MCVDQKVLVQKGIKMIILQQQNSLIIFAWIKTFPSPLMWHPRERDRGRTLTLLKYGFILITLDMTAAQAAKKISGEEKKNLPPHIFSSLKFNSKLCYIFIKNTCNDFFTFIKY